MAGQVVSTLGTQVALVALPTQIFLLSHSAALVGSRGAFELGPMIVASLLGGHRRSPSTTARIRRPESSDRRSAGVLIAVLGIGEGT